MFPKFCKLDEFFLYFDKISKKRLLQWKNSILIMYIIYIINRAFLAPEAGAPKNQNYDEKF